MAKKKKRESIIESIIEGIQDRKGEGITVVDLTGIEDTVCRYFVICEGGTPNQTLAIEDSIRETPLIMVRVFGCIKKPATPLKNQT